MMDDKEQSAIDALRAAGLNAEADAVQALRIRHNDTMNAYNAGQRASYASGQLDERKRCVKVCEERAAYYDSGDDDRPDSRRAIACKACVAAILGA